MREPQNQSYDPLYGTDEKTDGGGKKENLAPFDSLSLFFALIKDKKEHRPDKAERGQHAQRDITILHLIR